MLNSGLSVDPNSCTRALQKYVPASIGKGVVVVVVVVVGQTG